jgi:dolichol-phosphate mannosyltransferase
LEYLWKGNTDLMQDKRVTIIMPAFREGDAIIPVLERLSESISFPFECLIIIDEVTDETIKAVRDFANHQSEFRYVANDLGLGPAFAIRKGFEVAEASVAVVTMADGSDDPRLIEDLVRLVERGVVIAAASRYMSGGQQIGAPRFKSLLSRFAGISLNWLAGVGTKDATNSFKAYDVNFVRSVGIQSDQGFELGLELTAKAKRLGMAIAELPTIWIERNQGDSKFKVLKWLPHYVKWYFYAFGKDKAVEDLLRSSQRFNAKLKRLKK